MRVTLWGTRGSVPTPTAQATRYGGNTPCVEVRSADGQLLILDGGIGLHWLGQALLADCDGGEAHLLLTHTHWGHIQGLPFFQPMLERNWRFTIVGPAADVSLSASLQRQMDEAYCPVPNFLEDGVGAGVTIDDLDERVFQVGATRVTARFVNHVPGTPCLGYRLDNGASSLAYIPDVEYLTPADRKPALELAAGVDLLIHDAHVTAAEYGGARGCGHASDDDAVAVAREAGARRLLLFHHHPDRADGAIDALVTAHRRAGAPVEAAAEGTRYDLEEH